MRLRVGRRGWLWRWCWIWQPFLGHERRPSTIPTHLTQQSFSTGMSQWAPLEYQLPWALSVPYYTKTTSIMLQVVTTALGVVRHKRFHRQRRISTLNLQLQQSSTLEEPPYSPHLVSTTSPTFLRASKVEEPSGHQFHRLILPFPIYSPPILVPASFLRKQRPSTWSIILVDPRNLPTSWGFRRAVFFAHPTAVSLCSKDQ